MKRIGEQALIRDDLLEDEDQELFFAKGNCSKCGKSVIVWGDIKKKLCISCDEK